MWEVLLGSFIGTGLTIESYPFLTVNCDCYLKKFRLICAKAPKKLSEQNSIVQFHCNAERDKSKLGVCQLEYKVKSARDIIPNVGKGRKHYCYRGSGFQRNAPMLCNEEGKGRIVRRRWKGIERSQMYRRNCARRGEGHQIVAHAPLFLCTIKVSRFLL